jgi:hypothetical protein
LATLSVTTPHEARVRVSLTPDDGRSIDRLTGSTGFR